MRLMASLPAYTYRIFIHINVNFIISYHCGYCSCHNCQVIIDNKDDKQSLSSNISGEIKKSLIGVIFVFDRNNTPNI